MKWNKADLITTKKKAELGEQPIFQIDKIAIDDQTILTADFFSKEIDDKVKEYNKDRCFIILNEKCVNAYAYRMHDVEVVALSAGSLYQCLRAANLLMLSEDFFPDIGNLDACYENVTADRFLAPPSENGDIQLLVSGDNERRNIGYMITSLAIKFMVYHEIGHHEKGHLEKHSNVFGLDLGEKGIPKRGIISAEEYQEMEFEADLYAVSKLTSEYDELKQKWAPHVEVDLNNLAFTQLLIAALVIVKENLSSDVFSAEEMDRSKYPPKIVRLIYSAVAGIGCEYNYLIHQFADDLSKNTELKKALEADIGPIPENDEKKTMDALFYFFGYTILNVEEVYTSIFYPEGNPFIYHTDLRNLEIWRKKNK